MASRQEFEAQAAAVPIKVSTFLEDFRGMDVRQAKAILQGILQCVHVWRDGRVELKFR